MKIKILAIVFILIMICSGSSLIIKADSYNKSLCEKEKYCSYSELTNMIIQLQHNYPHLFTYYSLGKTYEGRDIWLVKISDNVSNDENEPEVLFSGGMHGDEKQGYQVVIYSMKAIVENYTSTNVNLSFTNNIRYIVNNSEMYFIPMLNPDGCEAGTRKNRRPNNCPFGKTLFSGVDIARNSGYKWELLDEHPFRYSRSAIPKIWEKINVKYPFLDWRSLLGEGCYRGPYPLSENESKALKYVAENYNISIWVDHHSYGKKIIYPWGWTKESTADESLYVSIAEGMSDINGLEIQQMGKWYAILGVPNDWMYAEHGIISYSIELPPTNADGFAFSWMNEPLLPMCKTHLLVHLYVAERAIELFC